MIARLTARVQVQKPRKENVRKVGEYDDGAMDVRDVFMESRGEAFLKHYGLQPRSYEEWAAHRRQYEQKPVS
jgi:hypothetical protein